jgi:hypothetical protein
MFGSATINCLWFLYTPAERQVLIKQNTMSALSGSLQNKMDWLHNAVIIANDELLVKQKSSARRHCFSVKKRGGTVPQLATWAHGTAWLRECKSCTRQFFASDIRARATQRAVPQIRVAGDALAHYNVQQVQQHTYRLLGVSKPLV